MNNKNLSRRKFLKQTVAGLAASAIAPSLLLGNEKGCRPNVVIIYTDDQNYEHIGSYGGNVLTPYQDSLAEEGVRFTRAYATASICTPSRYSLLTGRYPGRSAADSFKKEYPEGKQIRISFNTHLHPKEPNLAMTLKNAGYKTGIVGKWDFGSPIEEKPDNNNFIPLPKPDGWQGAWHSSENELDIRDPEISKILKHNHKEICKYANKLGFDYADALYRLNPEMAGNHELNTHNVEWVTEAALKFLDQNKEEPFFLYMAPTLNHIPHPQEALLQGDPRVTEAGYLDRDPQGGMPTRKEIVEKVVKAGFPAETAYTTWLDESIGAVINKLKKDGTFDNTIFVLMSDHQTHCKQSLYEGGVKTPFIIRYPKEFQRDAVNDELVQNTDVVPTIMDLLKIGKSSAGQIDGKSLAPMLKGKQEKIHDYLYLELGWTRAIVSKKWKYLALRYSKEAEEMRRNGKNVLYHELALEPQQHHALLQHPNYWDSDQLYDLELDLIETANFAYSKTHSEILKDMQRKLTRVLKTYGNHPFGEFVS